jgi:hypothetical protein
MLINLSLFAAIFVTTSPAGCPTLSQVEKMLPRKKQVIIIRNCFGACLLPTACLGGRVAGCEKIAPANSNGNFDHACKTAIKTPKIQY